VIDGAKSYKTAGAFRAALETRLQTRARAQGSDLQRLRRQVAFDRLLARTFSKGPQATYPWVLKGGYAMELRMHSARTTKDFSCWLLLHDIAFQAARFRKGLPPKWTVFAIALTKTVSLPCF
jgi:hypothetical protein